MLIGDNPAFISGRMKLCRIFVSVSITFFNDSLKKSSSKKHRKTNQLIGSSRWRSCTAKKRNVFIKRNFRSQIYFCPIIKDTQFRLVKTLPTTSPTPYSLILHKSHHWQRDFLFK